jgi:hypothetical protein
MGTGKDSSAVAPAGTPIRVKVQSPRNLPIKGATVEVLSLREDVTDKEGFVKFTLTDDEFDKASGQVTLRIRKFHHGPNPGPGKKVVPAQIEIIAKLVKNKGFDPATKGLETDKLGPFLVVVLADAGVNLGNEHADIRCRDLTPSEAREALLFHQWNEHMILTIDRKEFDFEFEHFQDLGTDGKPKNFFSPCDSRCKIKVPDPQKLVGIKEQTARGVKYVYVNNTPFVNKKPGMDWADVLITTLDPRNAVGVCRLSKVLKDLDGAIAGVYHIGMNGSDRNDCHGFGRAMDFGGVTKKLPSKADGKPITGGFTQQEISSDDFFIFWHWGTVKPWDPASTIGTDRTKWKRLTSDLPATTFPRLHYRLLDPLPADASQFAADVFKAVHTFATQQYQDRFESKQAEKAQQKELDKLNDDAQKAREKADKIHADKLAEAQKKIDAAHKKVEDAKTAGKPQTEIDKLQKQAEQVEKDAPKQAEAESKPSEDDAVKKRKTADTKKKSLDALAVPAEIGEVPSFILHPDYPVTDSTGCTDKDGKPVSCKNGRQAHVNHIHFQIGGTHTKTPFE